ncbi:MAG: OmpH family outer membrane protein [Rhodospirillaceae bacterium]
MMTRIMRSVATAAAVAFAVTVPTGQARADMKTPVIAVVDVQYILHESSAGKGIENEFKRQRESLSKELSGREERLRQGEQELARQRSSLSEDAFGKKRRDFEKQVMDFQREAQGRQKAIDQGVNEAGRTLQGALLEVVAAMAEESGVNLVLTKQQVVIVEKTMEITKEALERLNRKMPSVAVKIPSSRN